MVNWIIWSCSQVEFSLEQSIVDKVLSEQVGEESVFGKLVSELVFYKGVSELDVFKSVFEESRLIESVIDEV